jgi:hypothetical protein
VPEDATSFHLFGDELPVEVLRPGEQITLPVALVMGGGPSIFDLIVSGQTTEGEVTFPVKISF